MILSFSQVISFGPNYKDEVSKAFKSEMGGMSALGLSVPPGFTITTEVCAGYQYAKGRLSESIWRSVLSALKSLEKDVGRKFGDAEAPLLVSVRSGAAISMPGMLDTVLNLGVNDVSVKGLGRQFGERFALVSKSISSFKSFILLLLYYYYYKHIITITAERSHNKFK